jgi:ribonuclease T2
MSLRPLLITASVLLTTVSVSNNAFAQSKGTPGKFDFYVLALSWSPDYCAAKGDYRKIARNSQTAISQFIA